MNENNDNGLEFNKKNREESENIIENASVNKDGYWDKNNPVVKFILIFIGLIILAGSAYYIATYFLNK